MTAGIPYQLHVDLSPDWKVVDLTVLRSALNSVEETTLDVSWDEIGLLLSVDALEPDLVAVLSLPLTGPGGETIGLLLASLVSVTLPEKDVPQMDDAAFMLRVIEGIELQSGRPLTFVVQTLPVVSDDHRMVSLLTFGSPNVPLVPLLEAGFDAIRTRARLALRPPN